MPSNVDTVDVILAAQEAAKEGAHIFCPGKVVKYDAATNLADVTPMVKRPLRNADDERVYEEIPPLPSCYVLWPRVGNMMLRGKLTAADTGLLLFADVPWGEWLATGLKGEPVDARKSSIGYAAFLPGFYSLVAPVPNPEPIAGATMTLGDHSGGPAVLGFGPGTITAGVGGEALAYYAQVKDLATQLSALVGALNTIGGTPLTGTSLATALAAIKTAADAVVSSGGTTVLKGK